MLAYTGGGADLIWYGAAGNRTKLAITGFGILDGYRGSWSATTTAATSATMPGSPESSSAWPITPTPSLCRYAGGGCWSRG
jgi:hypothetical protein